MIGLSNGTDTELNGIIECCKHMVKIRLHGLRKVTGSFLTNLNNSIEKLEISKCDGIEIHQLEHLKYKKWNMLRTLKFNMTLK